jgi:hypothetical protein
MRFSLAVVAAAGWLFISGAVIFAALLPGWFAQHFGAIVRDPKDLPLWAVGVEKLGQGVALALLLKLSSAPVWQLVAIPLLLVSGTYFFSTWANYRVAIGPVAAVAALDGVRMAAALFLAAAVLRRL